MASSPTRPTREREALVTAPITGEPEQIIRLPGPGWNAFLAAAATAIALAAGTLGLTAVALVAGAVAAAAYLYWLWSMDRLAPRGLADAGRGVALPLYTQRQPKRRLVGNGGAPHLGRGGRRLVRLRLSLPLDRPARPSGLPTARSSRASWRPSCSRPPSSPPTSSSRPPTG